MKLLLRYFLPIVIAAFACQTAVSQTTKWREMHKVKRKETIFGIARDYNVTIEELIDANPEMKKEGYELKKGEYIFIPFPKNSKTIQAPVVNGRQKRNNTDVDVRKREVRVGIMLPLHNENGDGRRMLEYYRGILMACDSLKADGISTEIHAWNVSEESDIRKFLNDKNASQCDLIIGPLYSKQMDALSEFTKKHDIKLLIPFSINAPQLAANKNIFQVYQNAIQYNESVIDGFMERFKDYHTVVIDCNDTTSNKGVFTFGLRKRLEAAGRTYSITNLKSSEAYFAKAFSRTKPNAVILNTGRSPELNIAFAKLNNLTMGNKDLAITMFGYTEWMMYTKYNLDNYYKYDTHIPAVFYLNPLSWRTDRIELKYRWNFHQDMLQALPRFAITGFDHAYYFIKGMHLYGKQFTGARGMVGYTPIQTPLRFEQTANGGGYQNRSALFVHYTPGHRIETINF